MRSVGLIGVGSDSIPLHIRFLLIPESAASDRRMCLAEGDHILEKAKDILIRRKPIPIQPYCRIVDIVRIVVAVLRMHELITRAKHRRAVREHQECAEILDLLLAQRGDRRRRLAVTWANAIPAMLAIVIVSDQIVET